MEIKQIIKPSVAAKLQLPSIKVDVGSGCHNYMKPIEQWILHDGVDCDLIDIVSDFSEIPLPDGVVDELHSSDSFEHIPLWDLGGVMKEWNRIMKVGAKLTVQTPNLHSIMMRYAKGEMSLKDATHALYGWADTPYQVHFQTYTTETLAAKLTEFGFGNFDFADSPPVERGDPKNSWWIICHCVKLKNL